MIEMALDSRKMNEFCVRSQPAKPNMEAEKNQIMNFMKCMEDVSIFV